MSTPAKAAPTWLAWLPVITTLALIAGFLVTTGARLKQIDDHERRIVALEAKRDADADKLDKINERTARIEAKLELLVPTGGAARMVMR
jgi:hypothetical protein